MIYDFTEIVCSWFKFLKTRLSIETIYSLREVRRNSKQGEIGKYRESLIILTYSIVQGKRNKMLEEVLYNRDGSMLLVEALLREAKNSNLFKTYASAG